MSDIKARAEARRQKILARGNDRLAFSKGDEKKQKAFEERPLAARQALVRTASQLNSAGKESIIAPTEGSDTLTNVNIASNQESTANSYSKLDENIVSNKENNISAQDTKTISQSEEKKSAPSCSLLKKKSLSGNTSLCSMLPITTVMRCVRLLLIICLGICGGYRVMFDKDVILYKYTNTSSSSPLSFSSLSIPPSVREREIDKEREREREKEFEQITDKQSFSDSNQASDTISRSWSEWISLSLLNMLVNPLSCVLFSAWFSSFLRPIIEMKILRRCDSRTRNWLSFIMSLMQRGVAGVWELLWNCVSELIVHTLIMTITIVVLTPGHLSDEIIGSTGINSIETSASHEL
mmetsp:Transcript_30243/g.30725  ORF Transcript_30243/g.30725 Transcript_30243/m.30725 type:complete len:352 (-) Transcript_30243:131-1186(-)